MVTEYSHSAQPRPFLTSIEVAAILGVSRRTVGRWGRSGHLHPVVVGGVKRYRRTEIDRLLAEIEEVA